MGLNRERESILGLTGDQKCTYIVLALQGALEEGALPSALEDPALE